MREMSSYNVGVGLNLVWLRLSCMIIPCIRWPKFTEICDLVISEIKSHKFQIKSKSNHMFPIQIFCTEIKSPNDSIMI